MAGLSPAALFRAFSGGDRADFTITCAQREYKVHKMIICADSHYFQSVCKGNFKEQDGIDLKEEEPDVIEKVLHFLYFGDYHVENHNCDADYHQSTHPPATLYDSESTEPQFANLGYEETFDQVAEMQTTIKVYQLADMLGIESLKLVTTRKIIDMIAELNYGFLETVLETLFNTVPDSLLRHGAVDACVHNYDKVKSISKAVALLEKHEARIWRLARQNYLTHIVKIEHYVRGTIVSKAKRKRCDGFHHNGAACRSYITRDMIDTTSRLRMRVHEDGSVSTYARCEDCESESLFVVVR